MDRKNFFHGMAVQAADLNGAFDQVEKRFRDWLVDHAGHGVALTPYRSGTVELMVLEASVPNMTIKVKPGAAYTKEGDRLNVDADQSVDCSEDVNGNATIPSSGNQRYISIFALPDYTLGDPRTDPINGGTVNFNKQVGAKFEVVAGSEAASNPSPPATRTDAVLLADILLLDSTTAITTSDISFARKELFVNRAAVVQADRFMRLPANLGNGNTITDNAAFFREGLIQAWALFDASPGTNPSNPFTLINSYNVVKVERLVANVYKVFVPHGMFANANDFFPIAIHDDTTGVEMGTSAVTGSETYVVVSAISVEPTKMLVIVLGRPNV